MACSPGENEPSCADPTERVVFPSPAWIVDGRLVAPEEDAAAAIVQRWRRFWLEDLDADGWPARPVIVVPLSEPAQTVDESLIELHADDGSGELALRPAAFRARLEDEGRSLVVVPEDPFVPGASEVVVAFREGVTGAARPLAACGRGGDPHEDYEAAAEAVGDDATLLLALPIPIATTPRVLVHLWERLSVESALTVSSVEPRALDSFGERSPPAEVAATLAATAASGILDLPDYRDEAGRMHLDDDGAPVAQGTTSPGFVAALPAGGEPPYPFVLFQHGGGQDKADVLSLAGPLAESGFAFVAIDLPFHGDRSRSESGGGDMDILDFESPIRTRDALRQAAADHLAVLSGLDALNEQLGPVLGVAEPLDVDRGFYMGLSLGAITGSMTFSVAGRLRGAALFVGGGGYPEILSHGLFSLIVMDILDAPPLESAVALGFVEAVLDGADPLAYGPRIEDRDAAPRPALFMQAIDDPIVVAEANDRWARAFGADLALPSDHSVPEMDEVSLPASGNFSWADGGPAATRLLFQAPMDEVAVPDRHGGLIVQPYSQQLVAGCFRSQLDSGTCEAVDTGFSEH